MRKSSNTARPRRSLSNPSRISQVDTDRNSMRMDPKRVQKPRESNYGDKDTMIPKPKMRSSSSDRLSGMRKSNLRPTTGAKLSIGQYSSGLSAISPMPNPRYTHLIEKSARPSLIDQAAKGYITPMAGGSRAAVSCSDGRNIRASSAERVGAIASKVPKKDIRPPTDKNYQNEMLNKIDNYFHSIGQSTVLNNNGSLKPLTLKIFVEATNVLIQFLDIKQPLTAGNYIEEIPKIAKKLHYPGLMNKSWLKTANTMHSWPHAIQWICWLVELCEVKELASEIFTLERLPIIGESEVEIEKHRRTFLVMIQCYKAWNEEKPEDEEMIIQEFIEKEAERRGINAQRYDQVLSEYQKAQENLEKELAKTDKVNKELQELEKTLMSLKEDKIKQQKHMTEQQKYIEKTLKEIEQFDKDSETFAKDIEKLTNSRKELTDAIEQQPMSVSERDEIIKACTEQQTYIQNFEVHLEEIKKEAYSLDMRLVSSNTNLVKTILAYNKALFMQLSDSDVNVDEFLMPENGICESNFMDRLKEKKSLLDVFMRERNEELSKKKTLIESLNREIETLQAKRDSLSEKVEKKKATQEKRKQELKSKENRKREDIKKLQNSLLEINESVTKSLNELEAINQQLADSIDKREAVLRRKTFIHESAKTFFKKFHSSFDNHRAKIKSTLEMYAEKKLNINIQHS